MKSFCLLVLFFITPCLGFVFAQERDSLNKITIEYYNCTRQATDPYNCSLMYLNKVNKLLDVTYKELCDRLNKASSDSLKKEQLEWYRKRNLYYYHLDEAYRYKSKQVLIEMSDAVGLANNKASFERGRLDTLITRLDYLKK